jgi:hypothetical protein
MSAAYDAVLVDGIVYVFAFGENPTSGWKNYFQKSPITIYPPQLAFIQDPPSGVALQVVTTFWAMTSFLYDESLDRKSVIVTDAKGSNTIAIRLAPTTAEQAMIESGVTARALLPGNRRLALLANEGAITTSSASVSYERPIGVYDDWASQHCTTECVRIEEIDHTGVKICSEYRTVCQHIRNHAVLVVLTGSPQEIASAVESALQSAVVAAAIAAFLGAFITGGSGAAASAKAGFVAALVSELGQSLQQLILVDVDFRSEWV